jgi:hypothetical protein
MMGSMGGRRVTWLLSLPLAGAGWLAAHCLAYTIVAPHSHHGSAIAAPFLIACAVTLLLAVATHDGLRRTAPERVALLPVALLPPLGFAVQEHLEYLIEMNALPATVALQPTFLVGLALQLPFAFAAVLLARAVLALGHALGRRLGDLRVPRPVLGAVAPLLSARVDPELARPPLLATGHRERAPPEPAST